MIKKYLKKYSEMWNKNKNLVKKEFNSKTSVQ